MSMLAERKRKQKWSLNPRGNNWSDDSNKFGQKMLEKMGWSKGKGLGLNEDGMTEHVKVSYKNDSKGMGFKESENQWTEHDVNFQSLLENLNTETPVVVPETAQKSLEEKSSKSRARVHYHKFTRGKDLSRYSEKDLANIFGKKSLSEKKIPQVSSEESSSEIPENTESKEFGVQVIKGGSMADYFKKKLPSFGMFNNGFVVGKNGVLTKADINNENNDNESEDERPAFGFGFKSNDSIQNNSESHDNLAFTFVKSETIMNVDKKNKKKRKSCDENNIINSKKPKVSEETASETNKYEVKRKDKKNKKKKQNKDMEEPCNLNLDNPNFDDSIEDSVKTENVQENVYEVKRKNKKDKSQGMEIDNPNFSINDDKGISVETEENIFEVKRKDKKSKKKKKLKAMNSVEIACEGVQRITETSLPLTPILKGCNKAETPQSLQNTSTRRKSVRFSEKNQERLIPPIGFEDLMSLEDLQKCNELFDINSKVIESSLEEQKDDQNIEFNAGFVNNAFDLKSIDQMSFYMRSFEKELPEKLRNKRMRLSTDDSVKENIKTCFVNAAFDPQSIDKTSFYEKDFENMTTKKKKKKKKDIGVENVIYNEQDNELEENVISISKELENYQAEVENDINEKKFKSK